MSEVKNITVAAMDAEDEVVKPQTSKFETKNYLNVKLDTAHGEYSKKLRIRLLPIDKDSNTPFKRIHMHTVKLKPEQIVNGGSEWKSYVCLSKTEDIDHDKLGRKCPFCEMNHEAYERFKAAENDIEKDRWKKISLANIPSETGIVRCIERGNEQDGPKFWKFPIRQDKKDPMNVIKERYRQAMAESMEDLAEGEEPLNILDLDYGKDLEVTIKAIFDKEGNVTNKTSIDIIPYGKVKPLTTDPEEKERWVNDEKVWSDVFVAKDYNYLSIILEGKKPFFDNAAQTWVVQKPKTDKDEAIEKADDKIAQATKAATQVAAAPAAPVTASPKIAPVQDDLPF